MDSLYTTPDASPAVAGPLLTENDRDWFAVRVRSNFERTVSTLLEYKGVEQFLPTYRVRRSWADRIKILDVPLFPGYVFCRIHLNQKSSVLATSGVVGFVGAGKIPLPVSINEITSIQTLLQSRVALEPCPFLRVGQKVRIERGPLAGVEGRLAKIRQSYRVVVAITILQRAVSAEVDAAVITPVS
jgi:transcription antitermination factor NusG